VMVIDSKNINKTNNNLSS